jgi:glycosyltransferase involved in cell wall biosynthesis
MKILFLPAMYDGCYYYRGYLPGIYGNMRVITQFVGNTADKEEMHKKALDSDVIVFQRPNTSEKVEIAKMLKKLGKKIVMDNDDTYLPDKGVPLHMLGSDNQREIAKEMNRNLYEFAQLADLVTLSTETLAGEYKDLNENIEVLKNCIDPLDAYEPKENTSGKPRIGFIGSVTTNNDYLHIKDVIRRLDDEGVTIVVFGVKHPNGKTLRGYENDYQFWNSLKNIEWQPFVFVNEYYKTINNLALDLMIIPRQESYFNQCKSNLKFLEASLLKIPVVAQGFSDGTSPYQGEEDSKHMVVVTDNDLWYNEIRELLDNKEKRIDMAQKAHDYVLKNYNINNYAKHWRETILKYANR